jgi:peptidoglycan/xylan/chitin deacetylase (PgdA/CDA1 family)
MGSVVISIDAELGWGFHDMETPPARRVTAARPGWETLLDLLEAFDVPATWAVVGHLLVENCDRPTGGCACTRPPLADQPDRRFGPSLVEAVRDGDAGHELGCHSFAHPLFDEISREAAREEIERWLARARAHGIDDPGSFVFPRNRVGHRDLLAEYGFDCYRGVGRERNSGRLRRLAQATVGDWTPPLVTPRVDEHGLVNLPDSLYLFRFEGWPRTAVEAVREDPVVRFCRNGIDAAAREDGVFHCWLHPNNLVADRDADRLRAILSYLDERRGDLRIETMGDVAARVATDRDGASVGDRAQEASPPVAELRHR